MGISWLVWAVVQGSQSLLRIGYGMNSLEHKSNSRIDKNHETFGWKVVPNGGGDTWKQLRYYFVLDRTPSHPTIGITIDVSEDMTRVSERGGGIWYITPTREYGIQSIYTAQHNNPMDPDAFVEELVTGQLSYHNAQNVSSGDHDNRNGRDCSFPMNHCSYYECWASSKSRCPMLMHRSQLRNLCQIKYVNIPAR